MSAQPLTHCKHACSGQVPKVYKTKSGKPFMRTGAGSAVGVSEDEQGRVFFFDRAGNLYYDTGDKRLGFYIVRIDRPRLTSLP